MFYKGHQLRPSRVMQKKNFATLNFMQRFSKGETIKIHVFFLCIYFPQLENLKKKKKDVPIALTN